MSRMAWRRMDLAGEYGGIQAFLGTLQRMHVEQQAMIGRVLAKDVQPRMSGNQWAYDQPSDTVSPRDPRHQHYWIPLNDLRKPGHAEKWLWHLADKNWVTESLLEDLMAWVPE